MDASDVVDLVRVATCSKVLHGLFSEAAVKGSIEHCREASNRANLAEAHVDVVTQQRDTALHRLRESTAINDHLWSVHVQILDMKNRRIDVLEQALADSQRELVEAKRARTA